MHLQIFNQRTPNESKMMAENWTAMTTAMDYINNFKDTRQPADASFMIFEEQSANVKALPNAWSQRLSSNEIVLGVLR